MKTKLHRWLAATLVFGITGTIVAFCIFTNSDREYRRYQLADLPFLYEINDSTDTSYFPGIQTGANTWNKIPGAYFEFHFDGTTTANSVGQDNVNLVYFDDGEGGNFEEGTNTIAFSLTFTSTAGGYHAVESDLIWNSREFPPGTNGESNRIDLQSTITHELGHHMGLGHFTEFGSPPGCGEEYPTATMAGGVANGDTTGRSLHEQDIAGAIELYPEWMLSLSVTGDSAGNAVPYAKIGLESASGYVTGALESLPGWSVLNCPGYIVTDSVLTDQFGDRMMTVNDSSFTVYVNAFGYYPDTVEVDFNPANAIPGTEMQHFDVQLKQKQWQQVTVAMRDSAAHSLVRGKAEFYAQDDPAPVPTAVIELDSVLKKSIALPVGFYDVYVIGEYPYAATWFDSVQITPAGSALDFDLAFARMLVVSGDRYSTSGNAYLSLFDSLEFDYHHWDVSVREDSLPPADQFWRFKRPMKLVLISEMENGTFLNDAWKTYLQDNAGEIGNILLAGNNIGAKLFWNTNFLDLGMQVDGGSYTTKRNMKTPVDNALTRKWGKFEYEQVALSEETSNQMVLDTLPGYPNTVALEYEDGMGPGLVYHEAESLKVVVAPFSLHHMMNFNPTLQVSTAELFERVDQWFDVSTPTGVHDEPDRNIPVNFTMEPNYPNPFNPSTTITWNLPRTSEMMVRVFNIRGQNILTKNLGVVEPGQHEWVWRGINDNNQRVASGVYWLTLTTSYAIRTQKMVLLR